VGRYVRQIGSWKPNGFNYEWAFKSADAVFILLTGVMVLSFPIQSGTLKLQSK
jgi:hypothetical protein